MQIALRDKYYWCIVVLMLLIGGLFFPLSRHAADLSGGVWYFGDGAGLNFSTDVPVALTDSVTISSGGSSVICDGEGRLLFYTDGGQVWDRTHTEMPNGTGLMGSSFSDQPAIIIPWTDDSSRYYIFTTSERLGLYYSIVDLSLNEGLGTVIEKDIKLWPSAAGKISAVFHQNAVNVWVIVPEVRTNTFHAYQITPSGLDSEPVVSAVGIGHHRTEFDHAGFLKASPNGRQLAMSVFDPGFFELYDFDSSTGIVSNPRFLGEYENAYGVEFSPDSTKLYTTVTSWVHKSVYQFDLETSDIAESVRKIGETEEETRLRALQVGPDGRVYVARERMPHLGIINNPNQKGDASEYVDKGIFLEGRFSRNDLPTFLQSFFKPPRITLAIDDPHAQENYDTLTFTVTLSKPSRSDITVEYVTRDGSAHAHDDYAAASGSIHIPPGEASGQILVPIYDDAMFDEGSEDFYVILQNPLRAEIEKPKGTGTILEDDLAQLVVAEATASEGSGALEFPVTLSSASAFDISLDYMTKDGTARAGQEYQSSEGRLIVPAGQTSGSIIVPLIDDTVDEMSKRLTLSLLNPMNAELSSTQVSGTIVDDDDSPGITIEDAVLLEKTGAMIFAVRLSEVSTLDVTVEYATVDESAVAGEDYRSNSGTLFIPAGTTIGTVLVDVNDDELDEAHERFIVALSQPVNATIRDHWASGIIKDNDEPPILTVGDMTAEENGKTLNFVLSLSTVSGRDVSFAYRTIDETAAAGTDYEARSGNVTIPAGNLGTMVSIPLYDDSDRERDERFALVVNQPKHATLSASQIIGTIRDDDPPPSVTINDASADEGAGRMEFRISLSGASYKEISLRAASIDGSATLAGNDYRLLPGTEIVIPAGETESSFSVPVCEDHLPEGDERFFVQLYDPVNATLLKERGEGTILDNDALPTISIADGIVNELAETVNFVVSLSEKSALPVIVRYTTEDGTAKENIDYAVLEGVLAIAPQNLSGEITVRIFPDGSQKAFKNFYMILHEAYNAVCLQERGVGAVR